MAIHSESEHNEFLVTKDEMLSIMSNSFHVMALRYGMDKLKKLHDENGWTLPHYVFKAAQDLSNNIGLDFLQHFIEYSFDLNKPAFNNKGYIFTATEDIINRESNKYMIESFQKHFNHLNGLSSQVKTIEYYYLGNPTAIHLIPFFFESIIKHNVKALDYAYHIYESLQIEEIQDNLGFTPFLYSLHLNCDNYANYFLNKKSHILNQALLPKLNEVKLLIRDKMSALSIDLIEQLDEEAELLNIEKEKSYLNKVLSINEEPHKIHKI